MTWLPNYLQTARGLSLIGSGIFTSIPFFAASVVNIIANWSGDTSGAFLEPAACRVKLNSSTGRSCNHD
jgi:hypothetical protein